MHHPVGALAAGGAADMEDEGLLHTDGPGTAADGAVLAGGLPVALRGGSVCAGAVGVLAVERGEKIPLHIAAAEAREGGEVPRLGFVELDLGDGVDAEGTAEDLALEVVADELLVGGVEAKAGGKEGGRLRRGGGDDGRRRRWRGVGGGCAVHCG